MPAPWQITVVAQTLHSGAPTREVSMRPEPNFAVHRRRLLEHLEEDEAVFVFGGPHHFRNSDVEYPYRPHSDVFWLSGWQDPEVAMFIRPGKEPFVLFCQERDPERETWNGYRPGPEGAKSDYQADVAFPYSRLAKELPRLIQGVSRLHYPLAEDAEMDQLLHAAIKKAARTARQSGCSVPETFHSPSRLLHELRLVKGTDEVAVMQEAARLTGLAHRAAMARAAPGVYEYEIQALIEHCFISNGGSGAGYGSIVASGSNACVLHYVTNRAELRDGDLLLIDAGCESSHYTADVTRTFPVNGEFSSAQRDVYEVVLQAQLAAIDALRAGRPIGEFHDIAVRVLTEGMVALGLLEGDVGGLIEEEKYKKYYMHGTGHWLGLDVHDVGIYARDGESRRLTAGMVLTCEPGLYIAADDQEAPERLRGIGIRIEDDLLISDGDPVNLTAEIPKQIDDVEAACRA